MTNDSKNTDSMNSFSKDLLPSDEVLSRVADLFKSFDDFTRVKIMTILSYEEMCVEDLTNILEISQPAVSNHLRLLKRANLVKNRKDGKKVYYSLADSHVETILKQGMDHVLE